jgi:hypothetical protein
VAPGELGVLLHPVAPRPDSSRHDNVKCVGNLRVIKKSCAAPDPQNGLRMVNVTKTTTAVFSLSEKKLSYFAYLPARAMGARLGPAA